MIRRHHSDRRVLQVTAGFTLLEVILTLAMSVVLMILVGGAIQFYARDMNVRDMDVRQTQLAAAVMQMIEDDLRATLHLEPVSMEGLESLLAASGGGDSAAAGGEEDLSAAGLDSTDDTIADETAVSDTGTMDLQTSAAVLATPGLIGNQYQIQVDLSRLPRLEEYVAMMDEMTSDIDDVPSDLKTVAYFVQPAGTVGGVQDPLATMTGDETTGSDQSDLGSGGLVRRSLDRAVTSEAAATGALGLLNQTGELLAPEVLSIEFQYWDGTTWQLQWSSDEYGELPMAVKVQLTMADPTVMLSDGSGLDPDATRVFTHVIRLPLARPIDTTDEDMTGVVQ
ncbi:hypothetical protein K227x_16490 [Rubripirellula lacrimiformis]|uniref:Pseudopilin GspJ n=1 Tax=Rubripirellula lacrimiformis TaxID=1930273 RepID=A0A517N801_9BACT|nr:prepilin-type cleavage/methylation domain-containing protein [Rubripirellula lacrimiformis]QDT03267.1 hypothetical protein K227x_16490 [Rubripirellula lacrimiformis]